MWALVYHGPGQQAWEEVPYPRLPRGPHGVIQDLTGRLGADVAIEAVGARDPCGGGR